jgi:Alpha and gamma adaptin binding protein p34
MEYTVLIFFSFLEPMGIERLREALETNDWESNELGEELSLEDLGDGEEEGDGSIGFGIEAAEMEMEMFGMKKAIYGGSNGEEMDDEEGQDEEVEQLQMMMLRMQAVRGKYY